MIKVTQAQYNHLISWIEKLKTNPPKTTKRLKDEIGYCCLGVAIDLAFPNDWVLETEGDYHTLGGDYCLLKEDKYQKYFGFQDQRGFTSGTSTDFN